MSKITRRSLPALLASTAGLAAGFITAAHAEPGLDPIYEKINRVADADKTYRPLAAAHEKAERRYFDERAKLTVPKHDATELRTDAAVDSYVNGLSLPTDVRATCTRFWRVTVSPSQSALSRRRKTCKRPRNGTPCASGFTLKLRPMKQR